MSDAETESVRSDRGALPLNPAACEKSNDFDLFSREFVLAMAVAVGVAAGVGVAPRAAFDVPQ